MAEGGSAQVDGKIQRVIPVGHDGSIGEQYVTRFYTGTIAAGASANSIIASVWWQQAAKDCVIEELWLEGFQSTTGFTAGVARLEALKTTGISAQATGGADRTAEVVPLDVTNAAHGFDTSGDIYGANTAALTTGTWSQGGLWASARFYVDTTANKVHASNQRMDFCHTEGGGLRLTEDEGFFIRATVPATGTWSAVFFMRFREIAV